VCLVRATDGRRKVTCAVSAGDHVRFQMDLFTVIKASTDALKKPKRQKRVKSSAV
jgi:signal recognition particle subunit SRP14